MRCSNTSCGVEGTTKFCPECGHKMVDVVETSMVVICSGKTEDGSPCQAELVPDLKFCLNCGTQVDPALFNIIQEQCSYCKSVLVPGKTFCGQCGQKQNVSSHMLPVRKDNDKCKQGLEKGTELADAAEGENRINLSATGDDVARMAISSTGEESSKKNIGGNSGLTNFAEKEGDQEITGEVETKEEGEGGETYNKDTNGNLTIIPLTPNSELSDHLQQVNLENFDKGNLNIVVENDTENKTLETESLDNEDDSISGDSEFKESDQAHLGGEDDNIRKLGQSKRNKRQKKNKKKRKKDRDLASTHENQTQRSDLQNDTSEQVMSADLKEMSKSELTDENKNAQTQQPTVSSENIGEDKSLNEDGTNGKVFGIANSWKTSQTSSDTVQVTTPKELSLFSLDRQDVNTDKPNQEKSDEVKLDKATGGHSQSLPDENNDGDQSSSGNEDDSDHEMDADELAKDKERGDEIHFQSHEGTDVDTGKPSRRQAKNKKKKKKKKNKNNPQVNTSSSESKGITTRSASKSSAEISVKFHVLISESYEFNPDEQKVMIVMGNSEMGGWNRKDREMKVERLIEGSMYELVYETTIPLRLISGENHFPYKYFITRKGKDGKYEHYTQRGNTGEGANRTLHLLKKYKCFDEWHQYDGFAEKEPDYISVGKVKEYFSLKGGFTKHAVKTVCEFCPSVSDYGKISPSEMLKRIQMLFESVKRVYFLDARCWNDCYKDFQEFMGKHMISALFEQWHIDRDKTTVTTDENERILTGAFLITCTLSIVEINIQDTKLCQKLCKALLINADSSNKQCADYEFVVKHTKEERKLVLDGLLSLVKHLAGKTKDPSWLYLMPWVHLLSNQIVPFEMPPMDISHDREKPVWWGIAEIANEVDFFKAKSGKWNIPFKTVLECVEPLFELDYLLPRSFMTAVDLDDLAEVIGTGKIPVEVCLANLTYHVRVQRPVRYWTYASYWFPAITTNEKKVGKCINSLLKQLQAYFYSENYSLRQWTLCYAIAASLLEETILADRYELFYLSVQTLLHCLAMYDRCLTTEKGTPAATGKIPSFQDVMASSKKKVLTWMESWQTNWTTYMSNILQVWDTLFAPKEIQSEKVRDRWNETIAEELGKKLNYQVCQDSYLMKQFVQLYCQKVDKFNSKMQDCMSKAAFQAISKGYTVNYSQFSQEENIRYGRLLSDLFMTEWKKYVKTTEKDIELSILRHVLNWEPFPHFLKIYYKDQKKINLLKEECIAMLVQAVSVIESRVNALHDGSITVGDLNMIMNKEDRFPALAELVQAEKEYSSSVISKVIEVRQKEIGAFQVQAEQMSTLASLCQHLPNIDMSLVDEVLKKQEHLDVHMLKEFSVPADVSKVDTMDTYRPRLCAFKLPQQMLDVVSELHSCSRSSTFYKMWDDQSQKVRSECRTLEDVVINVWLPVKDRWERLSKQMRTGEIKFRDFENFLGKMFHDDYEKMKGEMQNMKMTDREIKTRLGQLQQYRQLNTCVKGAQAILKFAVEYKLTGDFKQIKLIARHGDIDLEMRSFDVIVMKTCNILSHLTPERAHCLETLVECEPLVKWLKEAMKEGGLKELKVFVDLAFMSAGEEPMSIARVQCLFSAVTGYAPLIFDLKQSSGYKELLELCSVVWKELDANPKLPEKLRDTKRQLQWLKEVKKALGSVEVTSLMQAEAINGDGIYTVGKNAWKKNPQAQQTSGTLMAIADTLQLTVPEQEGKRQKRNYTFSQLQDLQSRLMLVAGKAEKGSDSVERFTMIFDSITRLSNVYLKLCSSGCVLFKNWSARFLCDPNPDRPVCIMLEFGQGENVPQLKGRRSCSEDLQDMIPELAKFMETCYEDWLEHIKEKRKNCLHLNYYTIDQLVILQRELVKVGTESEPDNRVYPLLSAVKENCSPGDLIEAMAAAREQIDGYTEMEAERNESGSDSEEEMVANTTDEEKRQNFIRELIQAGYEKELAESALKFIDPEDVSAGIVWCMDHEEETGTTDEFDNASTDTPDRVQVNSPQRPTFSGWSQSETDIQTMITSSVTGLGQQIETGSEPLINSLSALWKQFLDCISSNIRDYLSLEHLGIILKYLAGKSTTAICRSLPPGFKEGQPNLIVCPSGDVLMTTLSVYMMDNDQPLPQSDEILMCTPNTTKDEVDIFWRRAIFDGGRKIHCLMNADKLDYDVSEAAERCLEEYFQEVHYKELKYRLLVICGSENEYRFSLASYLDKFKRQPLPVNMSQLRKYLATKLAIQQRTVSGVIPAADVDKQRSTVRVIKSWRAGVGKTLFKQRREVELLRLNRGAVRKDTVSIPLQEKTIDLHYVIQSLLEHTTPPGEMTARLFHIDVAHEVENGVDYLLFNLLVLGCLIDKTGFVWRKSPTDIYLIETMPLMVQAANRRGRDLQYVHQMLSILPDLTCRSPVESLQIYIGFHLPDYKDSDQLFDEKQFRSPVFQRTYQYLLRLDKGRQLGDVQPFNPEGTPQSCLQTLLRHCGLQDPSWSELQHFVWFLNTQLVDFENNMFVSAAAAEDLPGFSTFVLRFLIQMSRDFSTRSLDMSEESPGLRPDTRTQPERMDMGEEEDEEGNGDELHHYQMRRTWESSPHPYLFFNSDRFSFTFLGFFIDRATGNLIDQQTRTVLEQGIMAQNLYDSLVRNHAPMQENFDALPRDQKIMKLCNIMGVEMPHDPDDTYELTTDNVKKITAIYMRFRCDIPVIIMGETGCGKTRLVKFMCALQMPPGIEQTNMILMKVHGGTTNKDIIKKVREAERIANANKEKYGDYMYTVLFFDEANTTEAIGLIKEIMCDKSMEGKKLKLCENLKMVAACNPYRKHSDELIQKLQQAGLGYHVDAEKTTDRLGRVPMRHLVYRVQPLPQSLLPLVWDFGQLNTQVEDLYIRQMVRRYIREDKLPDVQGLIEVVSAILTASQEYMRNQRDECSFVSLRDVDRVLTVMSWFYEQSLGDRTLFELMDEQIYGINEDTSSEEESDIEEEQTLQEDRVDDVRRSLILALGVCYHACLKSRSEYRSQIARSFRAPCQLPGGEDQIKEEIECCQEVFLDHVHLEKNIARNMALKENVFMMIVCIELRIPLFLVGKPGSSKSLAKTIVSDAMQGNAAKADLFKNLKQAQMVSFQCSPLSTPDGIVGTFKQCAQFQKDKDLDTFVSIVVLDEVGLAEDSPRMPLKTLHPLLEDGCQGDEKPEKHKKVAFIGISNWALDPAKMNRGILVQREVPYLEELVNSASGICSTEDKLGHLIKPLIEPMAKSYLEIFDKASQSKREFYGLRDFYSLVKMVYSFVEKSKQNPTWHEMLHAIKRNFGGLDQIDPVESFRKNLATVVHFEMKPRRTDPDCSPAGLVQACLFDTNKMQSESRYLLLLTENYGTLAIIQQQILLRSRDIRPITIFGSSFRSDQEYTQVCRNINKIKVCMETGNTVVLLNLENLYESLYDALNQYYDYFGGERYVDLGLGTHRVKCPVHRMFRLIVVAEKQTVYDKFPTPLINRLEKHFLTINTMLSPEQQEVVRKLENWTEQFVTQRNVGYTARHNTPSTKVGDVFIGFHDDTCSAIVLHVWTKHENIENEKDRDSKVLQDAKSVLLWCATPDSLVRLENSTLDNQEKKLLERMYVDTQSHDSLMQYLNMKIVKEECSPLFAQITTHSKLMAGVHKKEISNASGILVEKILLLETLSSFDTEQQFSNRIQQHIQNTDKDPSLMVIQCDSGDINANLISCARYCVMDEYEKMRDELRAPVHVVFIIQLPRGASFTGFQCGIWHSAHIDDLYTEDMNMPTLHDMQGKSVAKLFTDAIEEPVEMETDEELPRESEAEEMEWSETRQKEQTPRDYLSGMESFAPENERDLRGAPLQLDDVLIDLQSVDKHDGEGFSRGGFGKHRLNVKGLILACVQAALSMVKDKEENTNKATDRVSLVLKLLHQEQVADQGSFLHGVCCLIAKLLKEKESRTHAAHMAQHWLINEAASPENISKAGTFRRSCIQTLESKISPILAGIIAYLDTNDNLKILQEECQWKQKLWLAFLNTVDALNLQFTDLQTPIKQHDLQEVVVQTTGCEGHLFSARMPFSWLLISLINEMLKLPHPSAQSLDNEERDDTVSRVISTMKILSEHAVAKVLRSVTSRQADTEAVNEYIYDFVHTMYNAASDQEHQLVCKSVYHVANTMATETEEHSLLQSVVNVHVAYEKLAPRLTYFRAMNSVWSDCSSTIIDLKGKKPDHFMFAEQEFPFSALCLLIENLSPKSTDLNSLKGRSHWLNKVHRYRPVVEKVISLHGEDPKLYGAHSFQSVHRAKCLWSRVMVVKLFLEHVCASEMEDKITIKHCMPLWMLLGDETDLKELKSFTGVEKFLRSCNRHAMKEYIGDEVKCSQCESVLEGPPITLPCKDVVCDQCFDGMKAFGENQCLKCQKIFEEDWKPQRQLANKKRIEKLKDYQKRCNTFFMDVVSQLCFANNTAPSHDVVKKLLGYIFFTTRGKQQRTRDLTIFDTGIDPNPVFRSFLLQLLIRTSEENVMENLEEYLNQAKGFIKQDPAEQGQQYVELCLMVIQCLEDMFTQEANRADVDEEHYTSQALHRAKQTIAAEELNVEKLYGMASARMGLAVTARIIADIVVNDVDPRHVDRRVRKLIEAAQILCEDTKIKLIRIYLVKHLCRSYGIDLYQTICRNPPPFLRWISVTDMHRDQVEVSDRYMVSGDHYKTLRESVTKVLLGENVHHLTETIQELQTAGVRVEPFLRLAIHREVTSSYLYPEQQRKLKPQIMETLNEFVETCSAVQNKEFMLTLIRNRLTPRRLKYVEGEDLRFQGVQCLIIHFLSVMSYLKGDRTLLQPLQTIMMHPQNCTNMFLPTMPQDDLEDIKEALLAARQNNIGENPVFYRCPSGHPYVIGDCGRPATVGNCRDCGAPIGGQGHQLRPGNKLDQGRDNTHTGHILGKAELRGRGPRPERTLTIACTATVRLILHLAMYAGAGRNLQGVHAMIKPDIDMNGVEDFLWAHIQLDIDDLHRALGRSVDDVILLMHSFIDNIMRKHREGEYVGAEVFQLSTKRGRQQWETTFSGKFLQALQNVEIVLHKCNRAVVEDKRLGADPLLCLLYETETNEERENPDALQKIPRVWRYRTPISLQHLTQEADTVIKGNQHKVLKLFLKEDHHLRALRFIPSILRLHRALFQKYQRKLDKAEASQITIYELRRDEVAGVETKQLLQDFAEAWELVRESLPLYLCPTELGGMIVSKEYCTRRIDDRTPISMLLPTTKEAGLCSYALLDFLMRKQNDFLNKYLKEAHRIDSISSVKPREVTAAHLICYDPQHDILPLVLANCQYSFEMGKGTKIEYDFAGLERQLMDRFLFSKSRIDVGRVLMIDQMIYRTEFTNAEVFRKLADKIPQEILSAAVKTQICGEIKSLPDLCTSLDNLDITISFLKSTGGQTEENLHEFMVNTLQMETSVYSQKAQQVCEYRHAQSLWLLLSLQKSKKMIENGQHSESTFESVQHQFHEELPDEVFASFNAYMKKLSIEKLSQLVEVLHEYILLRVAERQNPEDEDYTDTTDNKLGEWLYGYVDGMENVPLDVAILADFPKEILYRHSVHTWIRAYCVLREKQTGNFRRY